MNLNSLQIIIKKIGEKFTIKNTGTELIMTPAYYQNSYLDTVNGIITVPDIVSAGVVAKDINCSIKSNTTITFNFTDIAIEAKVRGEE